MPRLSKPYILLRRKDSKTFQIILNTASGLSAEICSQWQRVSFQNFPDTLAMYRNPKTKSAAETGAVALIQYLKTNTDAVVSKSVLDQPLIQYVIGFWSPESRYVREHETVKKRPLSAAYIQNNRTGLMQHIQPFPPFQKLKIGDLTPGLIRDWMIWAADKGLSGRRINTALSAMRVAVRDITYREDLDWDPFRRVQQAAEQSKERGILSNEEITRLIHLPIKHPGTRLAVLLGSLCGMRRGEVRGLQWEDIHDGYIDLCHNWQDMEGIKSPKWGSSRVIPIPSSVEAVLTEVRNGAAHSDKTCFVLESPKYPRKPVSNNFFRYALTRELKNIGISAEEQKRRNITFHSLRHTFVTLGRLAGISDLEIQALAGHKSADMMAHYSHAGQVLDFTSAREKLEKAVGKQ